MVCQNCGIEFEGRAGAKFCSPRCRVTFSRKASVVTDNVTFSNPPVTDNFEFTVALGPKDAERGIADGKNKLRTALYWYDVPLAAVPIIKKGWPKMETYMNGRQYFLWWKNEFKTDAEDGAPVYSGTPELLNPFAERTKVEYFQAGDNSRRWGA